MTIQERLTELNECAVDDGIIINQASLDALTKMLNRPLIFLLDNGNYRVRWNFSNIHLAVELSGDEALVVTRKIKDSNNARSI